MSKLPADCLYEIFEHLEEDGVSLRSCLLVNRLWCEVSVKILWRDTWKLNHLNYSTLINCLPNESKEILYKNGINISTSTSKTPMFNYASFCKELSINQVDNDLGLFLKNQQSILPQNLDSNKYIVAQEIYKMFMRQIPSLKILDLSPPVNINIADFISYPVVLDLNPPFEVNIQDIVLTSYPGAKDCLKDLSELHCHSDTNPEFFHQLSKICRNIQSLDIEFSKVISNGLNGLTDLISAQKNLKYLTIIQYYYCENWADIIPSLIKLPNALVKLDIFGAGNNMPMSFITNMTNLQELVLSFYNTNAFEDFKNLQYVTFPELQILKICHAFPRCDLLVKFLENNGKNLREFNLGGYVDNGVNLAVAKFCPNLRKLSSGFKNNEFETVKAIFNSCQYLESIKIWCDDEFLNEKEAFEIVKYSPKDVCELKFHYLSNLDSNLLPEELESFFASWRNRIPQKSLSLIIITCWPNGLGTDDEKMKIIKKYIDLGVIKKFEVIEDDADYI